MGELYQEITLKSGFDAAVLRDPVVYLFHSYVDERSGIALQTDVPGRKGLVFTAMSSSPKPKNSETVECWRGKKSEMSEIKPYKNRPPKNRVLLPPRAAD